MKGEDIRDGARPFEKSKRKRELLVKICGITNLHDARLALACGSDLLGLVFADSPRRVSIESALRIRKALPQARLVGVFADQEPEQVARVSSECGLDFIQLHGNEQVECCRRAYGLSGIPIIKGFGVSRWKDLERISDFLTEEVCAFLIDSPRKNRVRGRETQIQSESHGAESGASGDEIPLHWKAALKVKKFEKPVFVAGGLTPETVAEAVERVEPSGVDVSRGVESAPGKKSRDRIILFVKRATEGV